jgi:hypothetical protein
MPDMGGTAGRPSIGGGRHAQGRERAAEECHVTVQPGFGFVVALAVIVVTLVWSLLRVREESPRTGAAARDGSLRRALRRPDLLVVGHSFMRARRLPRLSFRGRTICL